MLMGKGLIIKDPWLEMIFDGLKWWEIRSRPTSIRGEILLIKSRTKCIFGQAMLTDCFEIPFSEFELHVDKHRVSDLSVIASYQKIYAWVLSNPIRYSTPIPYTHPRGAIIWVNISEEILDPTGIAKR